ncbi:50S ribosomal protein L7/L12 [Candidatus Dependentiae bacterium]|nr:50S ribosomal protein L7/L12 [Candidatus Dependentiae bacterium]
MASREQLINDIGNMTVLELAELVKALEEKFGVSAAMPMAAAAAPSAGADAGAKKDEEKSEYKVELIADENSDKIKIIKALRQVTTLGLTEAKKAVEDSIGSSTVLAEAASKDDAKKMKETLEAAGAKVKLS